MVAGRGSGEELPGGIFYIPVFVALVQTAQPE